MNRTFPGLAALAMAFAAGAAFAADDWHRSTSGVPPQAVSGDGYARGTGGVSPNAIDTELYARSTGGVPPQTQPR